MPEAHRILQRIQEECRAVGSRVRESTRRAVRQGVLRVDMISLQRDRGRALTNLGERVLRVWSRGEIAGLETDEEANRLRTLVRAIEEQIAAKEAEAEALRKAPQGPAPAASEGPSNA